MAIDNYNLIAVGADTTTALTQYVSGAEITPAAAASVLTVFDGTVAQNTPILVINGLASGVTVPVIFLNPVRLIKGVCHVSLTGAGATAVVYGK